MSALDFIQRLLVRRHGGVALFFTVFLAVSFLTRGALLLKAAHDHDVSWTLSLVAAFGWGLLYDLGAASWAAMPLLVLLSLLPANFFLWRWARWLTQGTAFAIIYLLLFGAVAEWTFWDEFGVRFNFIAIDYLIYTREVVGNIRESYNLPLIFAGVFAAAVAIHGIVWRTGWPARWLAAPIELFGQRVRAGVAWFAVLLAFGLALNTDWLPAFKNNFTRELAKNGLWSLFAAFKRVELEYGQFYPTLPLDDAFQNVRRQLAQDRSVTMGDNPQDTLRMVRNPGPELRPNVVQITVESLSADFLGLFNRTSHLTPNLEEIAAKSLVFDNFYATGTRTDRGMEALTLGVPPTPGRSIVKRPHNENLFTLGSVFQAKGYETAFIYGGFGYFDNMNYFFGHNGYRVIDRQAVGEKEVTVSTIWGACDGDLFRWTMREADASAAAGKPFHYFVMTTSNHRPYVYPEGKIDLPSKISGRAGAVKYSDYAIGEFIREAEKKPWFKNTVFVIVADHCARGEGKTELPVQNYHIPLIIYSPGGQIPPGHIRTFMSQVDYAPTLLGLLHWSYPSRFFGRDIRHIDAREARVLVGTYQKLGLLKSDELTVLTPVMKQAQYRYDPTNFSLLEQPLNKESLAETVSYYQTASYLYEKQLYRAITPDETTKLPLLTPAQH